MASDSQNIIQVILTAVDKGLSTGLNKAVGSLRGLTDQSANTVTSLKGLAASMGATVSAAAGLSKLVSVSREFDKINAGLITATGSTERAQVAFSAIQDFATKTPYDLEQVSGAFTKLVNYGLDPSEKALTSYGNTSASLGKSLGDMVEAVADAATGEFERLKEFGIKASSEGDKVSFTFRGITTTVGKNSKEIEDYLIKLGETNFGDAMANRMKTLDGALSNLGDEWNKVFLNISNAGVGDIIADGVRIAIGALEELNAMISSGELEGYLRAIVTQFGGWGDDIKKTVDIVSGWWLEFTEGLGEEGSAMVEELINSFARFPENVRAFIGIMVVQVAAGFDKAAAYARAFKNGIAAIFNGQTFAGVGASLERELKVIDDARTASVVSILDQRDATVKAAQDQRTQAKLDRVAFEEKEKARKASNEDALAQFKIQGDAADQSTAKSKGAASAAKKAAAEAKKAAAEAKKQYEEEKKIAAEKMRFASQEKLLALELDKIDASTKGSRLARAVALADIERKISAEKISLREQEIAAMKADAARPDSNTSEADIIRAQAELAALKVDAVKQEHSNLANVATEKLAETEQAWRRGQAAVEDYQAAVKAAGEAGVLTADEVSERLIASGDDLGAALSLGFTHARESMQTDAEVMVYIGENLGEQMASNLMSAWDSFVDGSATATEAMAAFARSTISWLAKVIAQQLILKALQAAIGFSTGGPVGMATGGPVQSFDEGGQVRGWSPSKTADNIPAWLTAREFVHPVDSVDYYGLAFMEAVRRRLFPRDLARALAGATLPRVPRGTHLAQGGQASGTGAVSVRGGDTKLRVVNVLDSNLVGDYLKTNEGETVLLNIIRRNGSTVRTYIGG